MRNVNDIIKEVQRREKLWLIRNQTPKVGKQNFEKCEEVHLQTKFGGPEIFPLSTAEVREGVTEIMPYLIERYDYATSLFFEFIRMNQQAFASLTTPTKLKLFKNFLAAHHIIFTYDLGVSVVRCEPDQNGKKVIGVVGINKVNNLRDILDRFFHQIELMEPPAQKNFHLKGITDESGEWGSMKRNFLRCGDCGDLPLRFVVGGW